MQNSIKNYFQYFAAGNRETAWGFHLSAIGETQVPPRSCYPLVEHPYGRQFEWEEGRILPTLQLVLLLSGCGVIEWKNRAEQIKAGQAFLLLPGEWHRYRPSLETGWVESWLELRGAQIGVWTAGDLFHDRIYPIPENSLWKERWSQLHAEVRDHDERSPGKLAGLAMSLLAELTQTPESKNPGRRDRENRQIREAQKLIDQGVGVQETASRLGFSYPTFYRFFIRVMGFTPKQYAEQSRLVRAEMLLSHRDRSIKEIAAVLGYHSSSHFSHAFKKAYGVAPRMWREKFISSSLSGLERSRRSRIGERFAKQL